MSTAVKVSNTLPSRTFSEYFTELAANYTKWTGNSTYKVIANYLTQHPGLIDENSIINDNASGPAVATAAVIAHLGREPARIDANDNVPAMVDAVEAIINGKGWQHVYAANSDSHKLLYADNTFTATITNINIHSYKDALGCLKEMLRTLQPGGTLVATYWKRFAVADIIHAAQKKVRADSDLMKVPRAEYLQDGYMANQVRIAGFADVKQELISALCECDEIEDLRQFMLGDFTRSVRQTWDENEVARWPDAVDEAIKEEVANEGGIKFEAWAVTAKK